MRTTSAPASCSSVHLRDRRVDVLRVRRRHALHGDRVPGADRDGADADRAGWVAMNLNHSKPFIQSELTDD